MAKHPLDKAFDVPDDRLIDDSIESIVIPEDPNLDTIISLCLKAYKDQMEDIIMIEPKNRARYLEVAEKFLNQAKDAIAKKEQLALMREKQKGAAKTSAETPSSDSTEQPSSVSRHDLLAQRMKSVN
jgi:hypothetical protein